MEFISMLRRRYQKAAKLNIPSRICGHPYRHSGSASRGDRKSLSRASDVDRNRNIQMMIENAWTRVASRILSDLERLLVAIVS